MLFFANNQIIIHELSEFALNRTKNFLLIVLMTFIKDLLIVLLLMALETTGQQNCSFYDCFKNIKFINAFLLLMTPLLVVALARKDLKFLSSGD